VPGVIPEGFTLFVGPPKIGKSWFHLSAALGVAAGGAVLGAIRVDPRPVLYLALEDGDRRLQDRCRQLLEGDPIPEAFEYIAQLERARPVRGGIPAPPGSNAPAVAVMRAFDEDREQFE
jgi:RecA-family ATPase